MTNIQILEEIKKLSIPDQISVLEKILFFVKENITKKENFETTKTSISSLANELSELGKIHSSQKIQLPTDFATHHDKYLYKS